MEITITREATTIAVLHLEGELDGSNYKQLINNAQNLYNTGVRDIVLDLGQLTFMSSAGISALHRVALIFRGSKQSDLEEGWASYRAINRDRDNGVQEHVKLLNPSKRVLHALGIVGFTTLFEIHTDMDTALASFSHNPQASTQLAAAQ